MSFGLAALIVLAAAAVYLGLVAYHLLGRLDALEQVLYGGLRPPSRKLRREEFGRRFAAARQRAAFAQRFDTVVVVFVDPDATTTDDIVATLAAMAQRRHFIVASTGEVSTPVGVEVLRLERHDLTQMAISALPYCFIVDGGVVADARPVGSVDAIEAMLLEVA